jgi:hypothetical protein
MRRLHLGVLAFLGAGQYREHLRGSGTRSVTCSVPPLLCSLLSCCGHGQAVHIGAGNW